MLCDSPGGDCLIWRRHCCNNSLGDLVTVLISTALILSCNCVMSAQVPANLTLRWGRVESGKNILLWPLTATCGLQCKQRSASPDERQSGRQQQFGDAHAAANLVDMMNINESGISVHLKGLLVRWIQHGCRAQQEWDAREKHSIHGVDSDLDVRSLVSNRERQSLPMD